MPQREQYPLLVVDAGNSAVKFAVVTRAGATPKLLRSVPTAKLTPATAGRARCAIRSVVVSSVVPAASRILKRVFPAAQFVGPRTALAFKSLANRKTTGADRLANMAAAHARYGTNVLVASFGTAATFDIIDGHGIHRGGAITPGWKNFAGILSTRTALLPRVDAKKAVRFTGTDTRGALAAGVAGGYAAMVSSIIAAMKREAGVKKLRVVFTGGDALVVAALLPVKAISDPLLTMRGIAILARGIGREGSK